MKGNNSQIKSDVENIVDTRIFFKVLDEAVISPGILNSEMEDIESVLKHQLDDIDNFVRDDFKSQFLELKDEIVQEIDHKFIHSSSSKPQYKIAFVIISVVFNYFK